MRLRPLLPGQQAGVHCVRAGRTKSTSFPRAVRKGIGGEQEAMKEDCSNKISMQEKERRGLGGEGGGGGRAEKGYRGAPETRGGDGAVVERGGEECGREG